MLAIVDYNSGNLASVQRACTRVGLEAVITPDPDVIRRADRVIFPGVGSATSAVVTLAETGIGEALTEFFNSGKPLLGICLGSQIVLEHSEEGDSQCLGFIEGVCERFDFASRELKVPHIGWNAVEFVQPHPLIRSVPAGAEFYFVHAYYAVPSHAANVYGMTEHGIRFCSALGRDNLFATQFHLEKSGEIGLSVLQAFATWDGDPRT